LGAISKPTKLQKAPNSAMPGAAAPNAAIATLLSKRSSGFSGAAERPESPPWTMTASAATSTP
jgi:hypothetical protein